MQGYDNPNIHPYRLQRKRNAIHASYPRPPQPNTRQPNQITRVFGSTTQQYWSNVFDDYMKRRTSGSK